MRKVAVLILLALLASCSQKSKEQLVVFHAGSLSYPMKRLVEAFNKEHPEIMVLTEASGSLASARKITEMHRRADIVALADYQIIDQLLIPQYAHFNLHFATNRIGIAYHERSRFSDIINSQNWFDLLRKEGVKIGASDPDADPCGYRTRMIWQLLSILNNDSTITSAFLEEGKYHQRPKETDLIALLETGSIDYLFIYKSVAVQHGLKFLEPGDSLNLGNPQLNDWYSNASIDLRGAKPGETTQLRGEAITYGITIPVDAPNKSAAFLFLNFMLDATRGLTLLQATGLQPIIPPVIHPESAYPEELNLSTQIFKTH